MVDFATMQTGLEIIVKLISLFAITTNFSGQLLTRTPQTQTKILRNLPAIIIPLVNYLLIDFSLFFLKRGTPTLTHITRTSFDATRCTHMMLVALRGATVVLHALRTVEDDIAVPVVVVAEGLFDGALVGLDDFLDLEKVGDGRRVLGDLEFQHR